jgi:hypothetical protein
MNASRLRAKMTWAAATAVALCLWNVGGCGSDFDSSKPKESAGAVLKEMTGQGADSLETKRNGVSYKSIKNRPKPAPTP